MIIKEKFIIYSIREKRNITMYRKYSDKKVFIMRNNDLYETAEDIEDLEYTETDKLIDDESLIENTSNLTENIKENEYARYRSD